MIDYRIIVVGTANQTLTGMTGTETLIDNLSPGSTYTVILSARNVVGYSEADSTAFATKNEGTFLVVTDD